MTDKKQTRTAAGKPVTDEHIQHLADEAETGSRVPASLSSPSRSRPPAAPPCRHESPW